MSEALATAFTKHLVTRSSAAAEALAERLAEAHEATRAALLRAFARRGEHVAPADWWTPGARCHLGLGLPGEAREGDLWFDPLDVTVSLLEPWLRDPSSPPEAYASTPKHFGWVPVAPVAEWQLRGAHEVAPDIPPALGSTAAYQARRYCSLFSKSPASINDWLYLKQAYGLEIVRRMWGDGDEQLGSGGTNSGDIELVTFDEIAEWRTHEHFEPRETSEIVAVGFPFRGVAFYDVGLWSDDKALARTWTQ